jgi:mycothiol synthase
MALQVSTPDHLDETTAHEIRELAASIQQSVGQPPLSDQALTQLSSDAVRHVLVTDDDGRLVGYGQLAGTSLELAGDAAAVDALLSAFEPIDDTVAVWSHGKRSPLAPVMQERGYQVARRLHQLRRGLRDLPSEEPLPDGVLIRPFVPGVDEAAWLAVNAAAFAALPDQAGQTMSDIKAREREEWFDPAGFLLAQRGTELLGFHWTKLHTPTLGEVYVLGVSPAAQGMRLGSILLQRGLAHLASRGCTEVLLYVDDANTAALRLYERAGFTRYDEDVLWRR